MRRYHSLGVDNILPPFGRTSINHNSRCRSDEFNIYWSNLIALPGRAHMYPKSIDYNEDIV